LNASLAGTTTSFLNFKVAPIVLPIAATTPAIIPTYAKFTGRGSLLSDDGDFGGVE
jgi:hypothetical protein